MCCGLLIRVLTFWEWPLHQRLGWFEWQPGENCRPLPLTTLHSQPATCILSPLAQVLQTVAGSRSLRVKSPSIILDRQMHFFFLHSQRDTHIFRRCVLANIGERLLEQYDQIVRSEERRVGKE